MVFILFALLIIIGAFVLWTTLLWVFHLALYAFAAIGAFAVYRMINSATKNDKKTDPSAPKHM